MKLLENKLENFGAYLLRHYLEIEICVGHTLLDHVEFIKLVHTQFNEYFATTIS